MGNQDIVLLSKFSVSARRVIGAVNPAKLLKDSEYSTEIFSKVEKYGDAELVLLSLEVQSMLGLMNEKKTQAATLVTNTMLTKPVEDTQEKYMFGARS